TGFEVHDASLVPFGVDDFAVSAIDSRQGCLASLAQLNPVELDLHAEIDRDLADRIAQILQGTIRVGAGIADNDRPASPADHLIEAEVIEMASVGQVNPR